MITKKSLIQQWTENGAITGDKVDQALAIAGVLPDGRAWRHFLDRLLLWTGVLALGIAVIFFFAYNWQAMGRFAKFGMIEILLAAALAGYWKCGHEALTGKAALLLAAIFLGGLLALFGQTYQTGADPWQLFAGWSLLILPWVLVGCFAPLWLLWAGLVNVALCLYFSAFPRNFGFLFAGEIVLFTVFVFNVAVQLLWELGARRFLWLRERWAVRIVACVSGAALTSLMLHTIFESHGSSGWFYALYPLWLAGIYAGYRYTVRDLFMLAGMCLSVIVVVTAILVRALLDHTDAGGFLLIALAVIGMSAVSAIWLKGVHREFES